MDKNEFKKFCHDEFTKREFKKRKNAYYRASEHGLLCVLRLQKSYGEAYYINCSFFIGNFSDPKDYPAREDYDLYDRPICVISRDTYKGEHFMHAMIEYEKYTAEELLPYFTKAFDERIMPPLINGKQELLKQIDLRGFPLKHVKSKEEVLQKLNA